MIYELINPSDEITFVAEDDKIAFVCSVIVGNGQAGCINKDTGESLPSFLAFSSDPEKEIEAFLGDGLKEFTDKNCKALKTCFESFAYVSEKERTLYDDAIACITDAEKLKEFKQNHEDKCRTSMNQWVQVAWDHAKNFKIEEEEEK